LLKAIIPALTSLKFSILTPSYNTGQYIGRAIASVLAQQYTDYEHIIMDGCSTDNTLEVLRMHPHLRWRSEKDKGQSDAMNKAFHLASGTVVLYLNADDELRPDALLNFARSFKENPEADMIAASLEINDSGISSINTPSISLKQVLHYWPCIFPANPVSYAYKRGLQQRIGKFPVDNHYTMDYWFLLRAFLKGKTVRGDFVAGTFHFTGANKSANAERSQLWLKRVQGQFLRRYFYHPEVARFIARKLLRP
jgi:glycosyltransferase involved in cell wall biosynthesis